MLYSIATKHEDVGKLAAMYYFQIVMAFVWEATVFHGNIGTSEIVGFSNSRTSSFVAYSRCLPDAEITNGHAISSASHHNPTPLEARDC